MTTENKNLTLEIAVIKNEIKNIKESNSSEHGKIESAITTLSCKFDKALEGFETAIKTKADADDVKVLDNRFWAVVFGMLGLLAGIIATWLKR